MSMSLSLSPPSASTIHPGSNPKTVEANFVCVQCGKRYRTKDSLTRHQRNHINDEQFSCSICSLHFNRSDVLSRHYRIHRRGRKRSVQACQNCKLAKVKCDAGYPCCRCQRSSLVCKYEVETEALRRSCGDNADGGGAVSSSHPSKSCPPVSSSFMVDGNDPAEHNSLMLTDSMIDEEADLSAITQASQAPNANFRMLDMAMASNGVMQNSLNGPSQLTSMNFEDWAAYDPTFASTNQSWSSAVYTDYSGLGFDDLHTSLTSSSTEQYDAVIDTPTSLSYCSDMVHPEMNFPPDTPFLHGFSSPAGVGLYDHSNPSYIEPSWVRSWDGIAGASMSIVLLPLLSFPNTDHLRNLRHEHLPLHGLSCDNTRVHATKEDHRRRRCLFLSWISGPQPGAESKLLLGRIGAESTASISRIIHS